MTHHGNTAGSEVADPAAVTSQVQTTSSPHRGAYHHGDLRSALVREALRMLEAGEAFSLRGVARAAGVSQTAPYRHFPDRDHLEAAVAAEGFRALERELQEAVKSSSETVGLADLAVVYVDFALRRPALFSVMFENSCIDGDERLQASASVHRLIQRVAAGVHPSSNAENLAMAGWSLAHGLAVLHRDGKLFDPNRPPRTDSIETQVRAAFAEIITAR